MLFKTYEITIDLIYPPSTTTTIRFFHNEHNSSKLLVNITNKKVQTDLSNAKAVRIGFRKSDGTRVFQDCEPVDAKKGKYQVVLNTQTLTAMGNVMAQVHITAEDKVIETQQFLFIVDQSLMSEDVIESENDLGIIQQAIEAGEKLEGVDIPALIESKETAESALTKTGENTKEMEGLSENVNSVTERVSHAESLFEMRRKQTLLLSLCFQKLQNKNPVKMNCKGDSLTYGLDVTSTDKRPADLDQPDPNSTRASTTYPEFLQTMLDTVYPNLVTIHKMGKPGMTAEGALKTWTEDNQADVTLLMLGTNDATYGGLQTFLEAYRLLIERELSWNTASIMLLPPKQKSIMDSKTDIFRGALIQLAKEYGVPCLDLGEELLNIPASFYSDTLHFNGEGYKFLAAKIGSFLMNGSCLYPTKVSNRSLLIRERTDGVLFINGYAIIHQPYHPTCDDMIDGKGVALSLKPGGKILYSIYAEQDNTVCFPAAYLGKTNSSALTLTLDFGVSPQRISNSNCFDWNQAGASYDPRVTYTTPNDGNFYPIFYQTRWGAFTTNISGIRSLDEKMLIIPKAGYHTILVENTSKEEFTFYGLDFKPYDDVVNQIYSRKPTVVKRLLSKDNVTENKTTIPIKELFDHLRVNLSDQNAADNPALVCTVHNINRGVVQYVIAVKSLGAGGSNFKASESIYKISDGPQRLLDHFTIDTSNLTIHWKGANDIPSVLTVQLA